MEKIFELRAKRSLKRKALRAFIEKITVQEREFTDIENLTIDTLQDTVILYDGLIKRLEKRQKNKNGSSALGEQ